MAMLKLFLPSSIFCLLIMAGSTCGANAQSTAFDMSSFGTGASQFNSSAAQGQMAYTTNRTGQGSQGMGGLSSYLTGKQSSVALPTGLGQLTPGGLPPTRLDSLVANSGGMAFTIYGDEGEEGPPPLMNFNTIGDAVSPGLTTGHFDPSLPSAWNGGGVGGGGTMSGGSDGGSDGSGGGSDGSGSGSDGSGGMSDGSGGGSDGSGGMSNGSGSMSDGSGGGSSVSDGSNSSTGSQDTSAYSGVSSTGVDSSDPTAWSGSNSEAPMDGPDPSPGGG
jgi:hypothetical protein